MITLYFLYFYAILSLERDSDRVRKIHNPNQQPRKSQEVCEVPSGSQKGKKKKATPHHTTCLLPINCTPREGTWEGPNTCGWKAYSPCLEGHAHSGTQGTQLQRLFWSFSSLMLAPNRGSKREEEGKGKGRERGKVRMEGEKRGGREVFSSEASLSHLLPHVNLTLALTCTYCGAAVHWGALTSGNMSYCLPTWQKGFSVFIHPLASPNWCH